MKPVIVNSILLFCAWMLGACGKKDDFPPYTPPVVPPVEDTTAAVQYGTPFNNVTDPKDAVIYQVNMRVFSPQGNFAGVTARLDAIKALGANVVYLMPIYPVGQLKGVNSPYCVKNYLQVNPEFGTLADLRTLVDAAHAKGMSVVLDWVANHTAWDHNWIGPHKDWYLQDNAGNVVSPPNMGWNDVAQLNYANTDMRKAMIKMMKYWVLTANIDGFRCDYTDGPPVDFWKQAIDTLRAIPGRQLLMLAEGSRSSNFSAGFDYNFGFSYFGTLKEVYNANRPVTAIDTLNTSDYLTANDNQRMVRYTSNHDVNGSDGTPTELFGGVNGSLAAFVTAAYMKSVPMIYNGQEVATAYRLLFPFTTAKIDWTVNPDVTEKYKQIIAFRNSSTAIRRGTLSSYSSADVCAFTKKSGGETVLVLVNMRNTTTSYAAPAAIQGSWKDAFDHSAVTVNATVSLPAYTYKVLILP